MTTLSDASTATTSTATEGDNKNFLTNLRTFIAECLGTDSANKAAMMALIGVALNGKIDKTGAYTVVSADRGKVINCTGTFTLNAQSAASLGDGFVFAVRNSGTGTVTLDPNLSEGVNGATTLSISPGSFVIVYCDGAGFSTVGIVAGSVVDSFNGRRGAVSLTSTDISGVLGYTPVNPSDNPGMSALVNASAYGDQFANYIRFTRANGAVFDVYASLPNPGGSA